MVFTSIRRLSTGQFSSLVSAENEGKALTLQLSVLYRTHAATNDKRRPSWSSRALALRSMRNALARAGVPSRITFVADRGLPTELEPLVGDDEVVIISAWNAASSFRRCVDVARARATQDDEDTFYWFAEDDYLYRADAFASLVAAERRVPEADYFALYVADRSHHYAPSKSQPDLVVPSLPGGGVDVEGTTWDRIRGTTSTFGVRRDALLQDSWLLKLGSTAGAPFDGATWHTLQGEPPYSWRHLGHDLDTTATPRGIAKAVGKPVMRVVVNTAASAAARRRLLVAPDPDLAVHLEEGLVQAGAGWEELADELGGR